MLVTIRTQRVNSHVLSTAGQVMTISFSINRYSHSEYQFERKKTKKRNKIDAIQAELPFLLLAQEDKRKLYSQGVPGWADSCTEKWVIERYSLQYLEMPGFFQFSLHQGHMSDYMYTEVKTVCKAGLEKVLTVL